MERTVVRADQPLNQEEWFLLCCDLKGKLVEKSCGKVTICLPGDVDAEWIRRLFECVFRGSGVKVWVFGAEEKDVYRRNAGKGTEALVVTTDSGRSYADLLKTVRDKVKPGSMAAAAVQTLRKSRDGKLVIVVKKSERESIEQLKNDIALAGGETVAREIGRGRRTQFHVRGMDAITTAEEVRQAVCEAVGAAAEGVRVGDLRPFHGSNQAVTIAVGDREARLLREARSVRVGLSLCSVVERIEVIQCYRCWGYGHLARACDGADRSGACRSCGEPGHKREECSGSLKCLSCGESGHSAGAGACRVFREALRRAKGARRESAATRGPWTSQRGDGRTARDVVGPIVNADATRSQMGLGDSVRMAAAAPRMSAMTGDVITPSLGEEELDADTRAGKRDDGPSVATASTTQPFAGTGGEGGKRLSTGPLADILSDNMDCRDDLTRDMDGRKRMDGWPSFSK